MLKFPRKKEGKKEKRSEEREKKEKKEGEKRFEMGWYIGKKEKLCKKKRKCLA